MVQSHKALFLTVILHITCAFASETVRFPRFMVWPSLRDAQIKQNAAFLQMQSKDQHTAEMVTLAHSKKETMPVGWHHNLVQVALLPDAAELDGDDSEVERGSESETDSTAPSTVHSMAKSDRTVGDDNNSVGVAPSVGGSLSSSSTSNNNGNTVEPESFFQVEAVALWEHVCSFPLWTKVAAVGASTIKWLQKMLAPAITSDFVQLHLLPFWINVRSALLNWSSRIDNFAGVKANQLYTQLKDEGYMKSDAHGYKSFASEDFGNYTSQIYAKLEDGVKSKQREPAYLKYCIGLVLLLSYFYRCCCQPRDALLSHKSNAKANQNSRPAPHPIPHDVVALLEESPMPEFMCPISHSVMSDPVILSDGHTYDRSWIARWLESSKTSPMTRDVLMSHELIPNHNLRQQMQRAADKLRHKNM